MAPNFTDKGAKLWAAIPIFSTAMRGVDMHVVSASLISLLSNSNVKSFLSSCDNVTSTFKRSYKLVNGFFPRL
jgi:hypothetical protein